MEYTAKGAEISVCEKYRWKLLRIWGARLPIVFLGLNPSTADAKYDDPTIRRVVGFAERAGYGGVIMLNLFGFRATDPQNLSTADDPVGEKNDGYLREYTSAYQTVCAWGGEKNKLIRKRAAAVLELLPREVYCLGKTLDGSPRHPLYLPNATTITRYER